MEREQFLAFIASYIESDPEAAAHVANYVQAGLRKALDEANQRAADMEIVASIMMYKKRWKGQDELVMDKINKWKGKANLNWDGLLKV
ncbi:MAG: hypothetical protein ACOYB0_09620 [Polynucleobacter sp.]